jgi:diaminopimelate decarboxylase
MPSTTSTQIHSTTRQQIAGVDVAQLAKQYGSPTYVYDASVIKQRIEDLRAFDVIRYAQKACSNLSILKLMREAGVVVDAVSAGEIHRALKAGYAATGEPAPIVYTADIFDHETLDLVEQYRLPCNLGSPDMIEQLGRRMPGCEVTLRINPGFGHGHSQKTNTGGPQSKHGIWFEQVAECIERCQPFGIKISGIHMHIGSGTDFQHLAQVCGAMERAVAQVGSSIHSISAGGGLPIVYKAGDAEVDLQRYFDLWDQTRNRLQAVVGNELSLEIEPGRFLSAESGYLIGEIRAIKQMGENTFYLLDAGFNNLARPIMYGSYHPMSIATHDGRTIDAHSDVIVGGPLCESGDIFTQQEGGFVCTRRLPVAEIGDYVVIECAGAYGMVMGSNYNSKPLPAEVLIEEGEHRLIRRRQTADDLIAEEIEFL